MSFSFKILSCGSAPTSALNVLKFLVPWDPLSGGRNTAVPDLYCVHLLFFSVQVELDEQPHGWVPRSSPAPFVPHSAFGQCRQQWSRMQILWHSRSLSQTMLLRTILPAYLWYQMTLHS